MSKENDNFLQALQLTPEIKTFGGDIEGKNQFGIILYVNPDYTSSICPDCGFRKPDKIAQQIKNLKVEFKNERYTISYDYKIGKDGSEREIQGTVFSDVERFLWDF